MYLTDTRLGLDGVRGRSALGQYQPLSIQLGERLESATSGRSIRFARARLRFDICFVLPRHQRAIARLNNPDGSDWQRDHQECCIQSLLDQDDETYENCRREDHDEEDRSEYPLDAD